MHSLSFQNRVTEGLCIGMKFVLIEFCGYILETSVNRVTGISVIRGLAVLVCPVLKSSAITARFFFYWQSFLNSFIINFKLD